MIRRHFLAGAVGLKALCAAAALAIGAGQAQAATVDYVRMTLSDEYSCLFYCDPSWPKPAGQLFHGLPIGQALTGWLTIADADNAGYRKITFFYENVVSDFGTLFKDGFGVPEIGRNFWFSWNGKEGSLNYMDDAMPWSRTVIGTIELAPVPLPATAAILPVGLGALALPRKRRRRV